ncbi:MAG: NADH-quinone oxidoreductase subunit A [Actinomycetota bacterium]
MADYLPIVMLFGLSSLFAFGSIYVSSKVGPKRPSPAKESPYECGIVPVRDPSQERFPVKFYLVAMLFIIFDIELIFFYPWAVIFRELRWFGFAEMGTFVLLLLVAYFYVLRSGAIDWNEPVPRMTRVFQALVRDRDALRSPGEGGSGMRELLEGRSSTAPLPPDKVVV